MAINLRSTMLATICSLGLSQITTSILSAQQRPPDLSKLSSEQQEMIASACNVARQFNGPARYYSCLRSQRAGLAAQIAPVTDPGTPTVSPPTQQPTSTSPKTGSGATPGLQTNPGISINLLIVFAAVI